MIIIMFMISVLLAGGISVISPTQHQQQNSTKNQSMSTVLNTIMTIGGAKNISETRTAITNIKNVSIVPGASFLRNMSYHPNPVEIKVGDTINWTNDDNTSHTVTSVNRTGTSPTSPRIFDSGLPGMRPGDKFTFTFNSPGTYNYFCMLHPFMIGKLIVK